MAVNKQSFFESINKDTLFNEEFFNKVYGYSVCDKLFLGAVAAKLINIGRGEAIEAYNIWYAEWKYEDDLEMKKVAEWYQKECDKQWKQKEKQQRKVMDDWETRKIHLLTRKKQLLNLLKSTDSWKK